MTKRSITKCRKKIQSKEQSLRLPESVVVTKARERKEARRRRKRRRRRRRRKRKTKRKKRRNERGQRERYIPLSARARG